MNRTSSARSNRGSGSYLSSDILKSILTPAELAAYSQTEAGKDYYKLVDWRVQSIQLLTSSPQ